MKASLTKVERPYIPTLGDWVYLAGGSKEDQYAEFKGLFANMGENLTLYVAVDSDYAIYLNGEFVSCSSFPSFPELPVIDEIPLKPKKGLNQLLFRTYYFGSTGFSSYAAGPAGLFYEVKDKNGSIVACSGVDTLSRELDSFENGRKKKITDQLGYGFSYDASRIDSGDEFVPSVKVEKSLKFTLRGNKKCNLLPPVDGTLTNDKKGHYLVDLGKETVGYLYLSFVSHKIQKVHISYGEHLVDGAVPEIIGNRDFSFEYRAKLGENDFLMTFRRLGARYLELKFEENVEVNHLSIRPFVYPFDVIPYKISNPLRQKIYDTSVYTLECCYHEHYEDCPWREQCLYALDSRNQMLAGYYAFNNPECARSSLLLFSESKRDDGLLPICAPSSFNLSIPSFSLYYFTAVREYLDHVNDDTLLALVYPRLEEIIRAFEKQKKTLVENFTDSNVWNFYEWRKGLDYPNPKSKSDLILNCLYVIALKEMASLSRKMGKVDVYSEEKEVLKKSIHNAFFDKTSGLFFMSKVEKTYSELGNSLAILSEVASPEEAVVIAKVLTKKNKTITPMTLSMKCFLYDSLLKVSPDYQKFILKDIDAIYKKMLDEGATTFYETELGATDFGGAGSLCHGWSAMPIYYYHHFGIGH
jgi:hypothetical protein